MELELPGWVKALCILLAVLIAAGLVLAILHHISSGNAAAREAEEINRQLAPLREKEYELRRDIARKETALTGFGINHGSLLMLFEQPNAQIMTAIYPRMQAKGFVGVIALSESQYPGAEGCISVDDAKTLAAAGWDFCYTLSASSPAPSALRSKLVGMGLSAPSAAYFPANDFTDTLADALREAGVTTVLQGRLVKAETTLPVIGVCKSTAKDRMDAFESVISYSATVAFTVSFTDALYSTDYFVTIVDAFVTYSANGSAEVVNIKTALDRIGELDLLKEEYFAAVRADLERLHADLDAVEEQILALIQ